MNTARQLSIQCIWYCL